MQPYEVLIPVAFFTMIAVCVLSGHRFKLAKLQMLHGGSQKKEIDQLEKEIQELRSRVNEQAIELDGVNKLIRGMTQPSLHETRESGVLRETL